MLLWHLTKPRWLNIMPVEHLMSFITVEMLSLPITNFLTNTWYAREHRDYIPWECSKEHASKQALCFHTTVIQPLLQYACPGCYLMQTKIFVIQLNLGRYVGCKQWTESSRTHMTPWKPTSKKVLYDMHVECKLEFFSRKHRTESFLSYFLFAWRYNDKIHSVQIVKKWTGGQHTGTQPTPLIRSLKIQLIWCYISTRDRFQNSLLTIAHLITLYNFQLLSAFYSHALFRWYSTVYYNNFQHLAPSEIHGVPRITPDQKRKNKQKKTWKEEKKTEQLFLAWIENRDLTRNSPRCLHGSVLITKRERSRLERCWRRWKSPFDRMKFRAQCNSVRSLISKAKSSFLSNLVTESSDNPRTLWKTLNTILHRNPSNSLPESPDAPSLANTFLDFFKDKIERIRTKFLPSDSPDPFLFPPAPPPKLINFIPATLTEIHKLISSSENKQCLLDSIPTFLLKLCFNELGPIITNLVNLSLSEGIFPSSFKQALVQPLLKKPSLSTDDLNNFRPISNLNFISKILEKVVASRIQSHLSSNSLSSSFQSAYRIFHSTETTLLKIHNDLILAMDRGEVTSLILLDLSAAFDTVDHSILLTRFQNWFGLDGLSLAWFTSYLSSRSQAVSINDSISAFSSLSCGVPQGSVLGPLLFTLYTTPLCSVISKNSLKYHLYADDTQLYISFTPTNSALSLDTLTTTFNDILSWMNLNKLLLNPSKTEFLLIGTKQQRLKFCDLTNLSLSNDIIPVSSSARNLGFIFDSDMSFSDQIKSVSKSCHFHIRDIRRIRHLLSLSAATALANSLVSSKLDYCNSLYSDISQVNLNKLQRIQNSLARVITNTSKYQHITPILKKLHWLPIKQRIDYKLCLLTYKTLTNQQPTYLYSSLSFPSHSVSTRSSDSLVLSIPYVRSSLGKRAFSVIGPRLWNSLPPDTRNSSSLPIFRSRLKTHLFKIAFPP